MKKQISTLKLTFNSMNPISHEVEQLASYDFSTFVPPDARFTHYDKVNQFISNNSIYLEFWSEYYYDHDNGNEYLPSHFMIKFIKQGTQLVPQTITRLTSVNAFSYDDGGNVMYIPQFGTFPSADGNYIYCMYAFAGGGGAVYVSLNIHDSNSLERIDDNRFYDTGQTVPITYSPEYYDPEVDDFMQQFIISQPLKIVASESMLSCLIGSYTIRNYSIVGDGLVSHSSLYIGDFAGSSNEINDLLRIEGTKLYTNAGIVDLQNASTNMNGNTPFYTMVNVLDDNILYSSETDAIAAPLSVSGGQYIPPQVTASE